MSPDSIIAGAVHDSDLGPRGTYKSRADALRSIEHGKGLNFAFFGWSEFATIKSSAVAHFGSKGCVVEMVLRQVGNTPGVLRVWREARKRPKAAPAKKKAQPRQPTSVGRYRVVIGVVEDDDSAMRVQPLPGFGASEEWIGARANLREARRQNPESQHRIFILEGKSLFGMDGRI